MAAAVVRINIALPRPAPEEPAEPAALHATACVQRYDVAGFEGDGGIVGKTAFDRRIIDLPHFMAGRRLCAGDNVCAIRIMVVLPGLKSRRRWRAARIGTRDTRIKDAGA